MLKPVHTSFSQKIWKIFPHPGTNHLSVEGRDAITKQTYGWGAVLDHSDPVSYDLENDWWCSLTTAHESYSIWQGIEEEGLPTPKGIYVFDQFTGALVWKDVDLTFLYCGPEIIIAVNPQDAERIYFLEIGSGKVRDEILRKHLPMGILEKFEQDRFKGIQYPDHINPDTDRYKEINNSLSPTAQQTGPMSFLKFREYELCHRYYLNSDTNEIEGYISASKQGVSSLPDLPTGLYPNGFALDSFFMMNDWLVWVEFPNKLWRVKLD